MQNADEVCEEEFCRAGLLSADNQRKYKSAMKIDLVIDTSLTRKKNFVPIEQLQSYQERMHGTRGKHIKKGQDSIK